MHHMSVAVAKIRLHVMMWEPAALHAMDTYSQHFKVNGLAAGSTVLDCILVLLKVRLALTCTRAM